MQKQNAAPLDYLEEAALGVIRQDISKTLFNELMKSERFKATLYRLAQRGLIYKDKDRWRLKKK